MLATCRLVLYHYQSKNSDPKARYPIRLRVTFQRESKYYSIRLKSTPSEFKSLMHSTRKREDFELASHYLQKADKIIRDLKDEFTWYDFESRFFSRRQTNEGPADLFASFEEYAEKAKQEGRIKTFLNLQGTLNRVKAFHRR